MTSQLVGSNFTGAAQFPNYVNGRLLAAEDLATGQATLVQRDTWIGQGVGTGVVSGLWVTASATSLTVAAGLGITPSGEPVNVPAPVTLALSITGPAASLTGATFATCTPTSGGAQAAVTTGPYVLTALPACQLQGQAPMAVPPGSDTPVSCTAQWEVEGVQFKVIPLPVGSTVDGVTVTVDNQRNLVAHWCLGTAQLAALGVDPFNFATAYTGLDGLSATDLTDCDLPLCVFYWDNGTITFLDNWSVRRRTTRPDVSATTWSATVSDQRAAEGEARFLQFQDQVLDLVTAGVTSTTVATDVFGLLPPVGFLPVALNVAASDIEQLYGTTDATLSGAETPKLVIDDRFTYDPIEILDPNIINQIWSQFSQVGTQAGFVPATFFASLASFGGFVTWDTAYFLLRQSWFMEALTTAPTPAGDSAALDRARPGQVGAYIIERPTPFPYYPPQSGPPPAPAPTPPPPAVITYYYVTENVIAVLNAMAGSGSGATPYLVFVKNAYWPARTKPPIAATPPSNSSPNADQTKASASP